MKLIVGLGNPGRKYEGTRHNVGFDVIAELARRCGAGPGRTAFQGELNDVKLRCPGKDDERVLLLRPHTFMNLSGSSVVGVRDFYKLTNADLLVVCDDLNLPVGKLRIRAKGSSGGQKGLEDCIRRLGGDEFSRLRVGIGSPPEYISGADYVLAKYSKGEREEMASAVVTAADAVEVWIREGVAATMNRYN
jgi:PTH1 family peptidyl-tRNA hydrolase